MKHVGDETHLLREIVRTHQVLMSGFSRRVGMPSSRFALMRLLAISENDVGIMDLSRLLNVNAAAVTRQVKEMADEGLVRRYDDPRDKRRNYVRLSSKGLKLFEDIHIRSHQLERELSSIISDDEIAVTLDVLEKVRSVIEVL